MYRARVPIIFQMLAVPRLRPNTGLRVLGNTRALPTQLRSSSSTSASKKTNLRDENIPHDIVTPVDPKTNALMQPILLRNLLASIDRSAYFYEMVSEVPTPLVKLVSKKHAFDRIKEQKRQARDRNAKRPDVKEVQISWSVEPGDIAHKLGKAKKELEKGNMVNLVIAKKKGVAPPTPAVRGSKVEEFLALLQDVGQQRRESAVTEMMTVLYLSPRQASA